MAAIPPISGQTSAGAPSVLPPPKPTARPEDRVEKGAQPYAGQMLVGEMAHFDEASEQQRLAHGGGTLLSDGPFDPTKPPLVLVHGLQGNPAQLKDIAAHLKASGHQVLFFAYDDNRLSPDDNGRILARELERLRDATACKRLDVVAHSLGGVVVRAAMNSLANPRWLANDARAANPRAGFEEVRVRTLDTPWRGFASFPKIPIIGPIVLAIVSFILELLGLHAAWSMRADSDLLTHLYDTPLDAVDWQNTSAHQPVGKRDGIPSVEDLDPKQRLAAIRYIARGETPKDARVRNQCGALAQDSRYPLLREKIREAVAKGALSLTEREKNDAFLPTVESVMPSADGTHMSILEDTPRHNALVDRIVLSLGR